MASADCSKWSTNQLKFIAWLATPSDIRKPKSHEELAKQLGVSERTLFNWKKLPGLKEESAELARELVTGELPDIYGALIKKAKAGSYFHIKLALEIAGHYVERKIVGGDGEEPIRHEHHHEHEGTLDLSVLSDSELDDYENLVSKLAEAENSLDGVFPNPN